MINLFLNNLPSAIIALVVVICGVIAYRRLNTKQLGDIQALAIETYKNLNEAQDQEIRKLRMENVAMRAAFKQLGIDIGDINEKEIVLVQVEQQQKRTHIIQVKVDDIKSGSLKLKEEN